MPELACRDTDWRKQQISDIYDEHYSGGEISHCYKWKNHFEHGTKWDDKVSWAMVITTVVVKRSPHHILNEKIDKIYEDLGGLTSRRSHQSDPALDAQIARLTQELRSLQNQEADLVRAYTRKKLSGPIAAGLTVLEHADEILEKYGIAPSADTTTKEPNPAKA